MEDLMAQKRQVVFQHIHLKGEPYKIGRIQAEAVKHIPQFVGFLGSGAGKFSEEQFKQVSSQMESFIPGINEEMRGFADGVGIPLESLVYYAYTYLPKGRCSQFALLPSRTEGGKTLVGRSYEFGVDTEDLRLCTMHVDKKYSFIGSSLIFFGFTEGMNEHGLVISQTAGGMPVGLEAGMRAPIDDGFQFWFVIRAVLERCKTVDEAIRLINEIPMCGNPILLVADKSGEAALIEVFGSHKAVKRINTKSAEQMISSTNHYTLPEMTQYRDPVWVNSQTRFDTIQSRLGDKQKVSKQDIKSLLSDEYPMGLACHFYEEWFGTLRSMIFDPQVGEVDMCFGSPVGGAWYRIGFDTPMGSYPIQLPLKKMPPDFMAIIE
ncbi:MAG: acyl-CoA--6-aminopenicillanic acid acyltransferase [Anaerolinea sp.]|nr:acyl-CoA--6-aminopenicillanic acid acyltransferase [Anaerolinea sp.]